MISKAIIATIGLFACTTAYSDTPSARSNDVTDQNRHSTGSPFSYSIGVGYLSFASRVADNTSLNDSATGLHLAANYEFTPKFVASIGMDLFRIEDEGQYSAVVVNDDGFVKVEESETRATSLFGEVYFQNTLGANRGVAYAIGVGASTFSKLEREIPNCSNCDTDSFEIDGGGYLLTSVAVKSGKRSGIGLTARYYASDDLENSVQLWWQSRF